VNKIVVNKNLFTAKLFTNRAVKKQKHLQKQTAYTFTGAASVIFLGVGGSFVPPQNTLQAWLSGWVYSERLSRWLFL